MQDNYYNYSYIQYFTQWINTNVTIPHEEAISAIAGQENKSRRPT